MFVIRLYGWRVWVESEPAGLVSRLNEAQRGWSAGSGDRNLAARSDRSASSRQCLMGGSHICSRCCLLLLPRCHCAVPSSRHLAARRHEAGAEPAAQPFRFSAQFRDLIDARHQRPHSAVPCARPDCRALVAPLTGPAAALRPSPSRGAAVSLASRICAVAAPNTSAALARAQRGAARCRQRSRGLRSIGAVTDRLSPRLTGGCPRPSDETGCSDRSNSFPPADSAVS